MFLISHTGCISKLPVTYDRHIHNKDIKSLQVQKHKSTAVSTMYVPALEPSWEIMTQLETGSGNTEPLNMANGVTPNLSVLLLSETW